MKIVLIGNSNPNLVPGYISELLYEIFRFEDFFSMLTESALWEKQKVEYVEIIRVKYNF
ncbi:MAG TPA: hypothetical protein VGK38_14500 [Prolixibacteraceae bacterium]